MRGTRSLGSSKRGYVCSGRFIQEELRNNCPVYSVSLRQKGMLCTLPGSSLLACDGGTCFRHLEVRQGFKCGGGNVIYCS